MYTMYQINPNPIPASPVTPPAFPRDPQTEGRLPLRRAVRGALYPFIYLSIYLSILTYL